jgi:hypothetical protein
VFSPYYELTLVHESKWDTDSWIVRPPSHIAPGHRRYWESEGGDFRGCHAEARYEYTVPGTLMDLGSLVFSETKQFSGTAFHNCVPLSLCLTEDVVNKGDYLSVRWRVRSP